MDIDKIRTMGSRTVCVAFKLPDCGYCKVATHIFYHEYRGQIFSTEYNLSDVMRLQDSRISCNLFNPISLLLIPPTITVVPTMFERFVLYRHNMILAFVYVPKSMESYDRERVTSDDEYNEIVINDASNVYHDHVPSHWQGHIMQEVSEEENDSVRELLATLGVNKREAKKSVVVRQHIP